jgi:hypothetical protein
MRLLLEEECEKPNYLAAARALGQPTDNSAQVRKWVEKLKRLEYLLDKTPSECLADWRSCAEER